MPEFDYKCTECKHVATYTRVQDHVLACPACGVEGTMQYVFVPVGFKVKGFNADNGYSREEE